MNILRKIFLKTFGYIGVVDTQVNIYNVLKQRMSQKSEDEILNFLIISRIKAPPRVAKKEEDHYKPILENSNKTIEEVIWRIVKYEFFESRIDQLKRKIPSEYLDEKMKKMELEVKRYIKNKFVKVRNG
jgi:hypothetical protein